jgi:hypothetical protein
MEILHTDVTQPLPGDGNGSRVPVYSEKLDALALECRCVAPISQGGIDRPPGAPRGREDRGQQHGLVVGRAFMRHLELRPVKTQHPVGGTG